jgi:hypothetical protein
MERIDCLEANLQGSYAGFVPFGQRGDLNDLV